MNESTTASSFNTRSAANEQDEAPGAFGPGHVYNPAVFGKPDAVCPHCGRADGRPAPELRELDVPGPGEPHLCRSCGKPFLVTETREQRVRSAGHLLGASPEAIDRAVVVAERMEQQDKLVAVADAARAYVAGSPDDEVALFDGLREAVEELDA